MFQWSPTLFWAHLRGWTTFRHWWPGMYLLTFSLPSCFVLVLRIQSFSRSKAKFLVFHVFALVFTPFPANNPFLCQVSIPFPVFHTFACDLHLCFWAFALKVHLCSKRSSLTVWGSESSPFPYFHAFVSLPLLEKFSFSWKSHFFFVFFEHLLKTLVFDSCYVWL